MADKTRPEVLGVFSYLWVQEQEIPGRDDPGVRSQEAASAPQGAAAASRALQGDYILCDPGGSPLKPDTVPASVSLLFRTLKFPKGASLHTPRHTHGSHLLAAGLPLTDAAWQSFQNAGRPLKPQAAKPVKRGRARRSA